MANGSASSPAAAPRGGGTLGAWLVGGWVVILGLSAVARLLGLLDLELALDLQRHLP
jgi:hypothetical protein